MTKAWRHPTAIVDRGAKLGGGSKIWHFSHVMAGARIGSHCVLGQNVFVAAGARIGDRCRIQNNVSLYDGVTLQDDVFVGPSVVFTNVRSPRATLDRRDQIERILVGRGATIGANATIVCGVTIGDYALIGAGSVVAGDVPAQAVVVGVPARRQGWICLCGETRGSMKKVRQCACDALEVRAREPRKNRERQ